MAKLKFYYPIEEVHGALKKKVFGAAKRTTPNAEGEQANFSVIYGKRTAEVTEAERARWTKFGAIAAMVGARRKNVTKRVQDQVAFKAQSTYKTLTSYLWSICKAEYLASQS